MARGDRPLYVYALADPGLPDRMRICGRSLRTMTVGGVSVVVEPRDARPAADAGSLQEQHELLIRLFERSPALLPARFGSHMSAAHVRRSIEEHDVSLRSGLARVRHRCQMTIRIDALTGSAGPAVNRAAGGAAYLESRRARLHYRPREVEAVQRTLAPLVADERVDASPDARAATVFHLVPRRALEAYRKRAADLQGVLSPARVTVTGPWPAFAFTPELF